MIFEQYNKHVYIVGCLLAASLNTTAHADDKCTAVVKSVNDAGFSDTVSVTCTVSHAHIVSNTYPNHELMIGIEGSNEQIPIQAQEYNAPIPL